MKMKMARKIRLLPTPEQEDLFFKSAGTARFAHNYFVRRMKEHHEETGSWFIKESIVRKELTQLKKTDEYSWLREVGCNVIKQSVKDAGAGLDRFKKGIGGLPRFMKRDRTKPSFYVNYESLTRTEEGFRGEKIGRVRTAQPLPELPEGQNHYSNPRVSYDGKHWYLSVGIEVPEEKAELTSTVLGIDLGIKVLAYLSDGTFYKNINKSGRVRKLERRLRKEQRRLSRREQANIGHYEEVIGRDGKTHLRPVYKRPLRECRNYQKQKKIVSGVHKKLKDLRTDYVHKVTRDIIDTLPKAIVMEDLKVRNMMKNRSVARAIGEQMWSEFRRQIEYKARMKGIEVAFADLFFPSSKTCSNCGHIHTDLQLKDRIYVCPVCGHVIDRDLNASINLADCYISQHDLVQG